MKARIITALIGAPILLLLVFLGGIPFTVLIGILVIVGTLEYGRMIRHKNHQFMTAAVLISQMIMLITRYLQWNSWASIGLMTAFILIFMQAIICYPKIELTDIGLNFFAVIYIGWTLPHLIAMIHWPQGTLIVLYLFLAIWSSDSGAYFIGRFLGKHPLAPQLSPKKTVEGALGGIITTVVVLEIVNCIIKLFQWQEIILIGVVLSIIGQLGDLVESMVKRFLDVKDSGNILPGHGGILDRFDSLIMTAPFIYYVIAIFILLDIHI